MKKLLMAFLVLSARPALGQVVISGTVYDNSQKYTMAGVSVLTTKGLGTSTDSTGHYRIRMDADDSIYFSYLGKTTLRFPAREINPNQPFDMALAVSIDTLPAAFVRGNNYYLDSLATRKEYARVFNYGASYFNSVKATGRGGMGVGLNLDMFFNGAENRRMEAFQDRLIWMEQENFVDHHFSKAIVRHVTGLESPALDTFMVLYRPTKEFIQSCETEYQYYHYLREWSQYFVEDWKVRHPDIPPYPKGGPGSDSTATGEALDSAAVKAKADTVTSPGGHGVTSPGGHH
ncbi:MAG TPA: carboxypeptidase-like regulatory domain-containing protein [Puia sp.]|nr:carboxypeptidase-like regulatory domain-containing protein [Puia sp.]